MRLRQIEIFYHVYRTGSISAAARELNVSQPSVSKVLRLAEVQLGFDLFLRRKGKLLPTPAADELFLEAEDIYRRLSIFNRSLQNIRNRRGGHLRLGVLPSLSLSVGPDLVARMRKANPEMSFELTTLHSAELAAGLSDKRIDLAVGFEPVDDPRIENSHVGNGRLVLVSSNRLAENDEIIRESMLHGADMIGMSESGPLGEMIGQILRDRDIFPNEVATAHTYHVALSLVRKKVGLALTDQFTAYSHLGSGLHRYLLNDLPGYPVVASSLANHPAAGMLELAIEALQAVVADLEQGIAEMQPRP